MWNYPSYYVDTDMIKETYHTGNTHVAKQIINSMYGIKGDKFMNREYISVIVNNNPTVIFKRNIIAVVKENSFTSIKCIGDYDFLTKEDYASVVKKIIG